MSVIDRHKKKLRDMQKAFNEQVELMLSELEKAQPSNPKPKKIRRIRINNNPYYHKL